MQEPSPFSGDYGPRTTSSYGWVIVATCLLMTFINYGLVYSYSVFFKPLAEHFQWDRASVSLIYSLSVIIRGASAVGSGWLADKYGSRKTMVFCGIMMALGYLLSSRITNLWQFFLTYAVIEAIGMSGIFGIGSAMVAKWFTRRPGFPMGIIASGAGLGTLLLVPACERLVDAVDWSQSFVIIGIAAGIIMVISALFLRNPPVETTFAGNTVEKPGGASLREALKDPRMWLILGSFLMFFFGTQMILVHLVNYATDVGIEPLQAATFVSVVGLVSIAGRLTTGVVSEKIGLYLTLILMCISMMVAFIMLIFSRSPWAFYLFAVLFGIPYGGEATQIPLVIARFFGTRVMATLMGVTVFIIGLGGALGPWLAGKIFDTTGSYNWAFIAGACAAAVSMIIIFILQRRDKAQPTIPPDLLSASREEALDSTN
jgi:MFS transporter, OFA family, oxalate/formate antiporter